MLSATYLNTAKTKSSIPALTLGAIGVVYGDIGTSVLYAMKAVFSTGHIEPTISNVYGVLSLFFWSVTIIVTLKYVTLVLRADNHGEGGVVALLALVTHAVQGKPKLRHFLIFMGVFGACLFYGDGVITPAISVLAAVEGLKMVSSHFDDFIIPSALLILFLLFYAQKRGTAGIGKFFGPIMVLWFIVIAILGARSIAQHAEILWAINPYYAYNFIVHQPWIAFIVLAAVVLCVTGSEALYADMGHFGRKPIQYAWYGLVMPALIINYFGQGALLLSHPEAVANPFYLLAPEQFLIPMVLLATIATVIASQALISGAFSVTKQVVQLGYLPRLQVVYTNEHETGQIYLPFVNWVLFLAIVLAIMIFDSSDNLAGAYGVAVTTNMVITTVLTFFVLNYVWQYPLVVGVVATGFFLVIDLLFWSSNLLKLHDGGWFPLLVASILFILMSTWKLGRRELKEKSRQEGMGLDQFMQSLMLQPPHRVEGTSVFLNANPRSVPHAFLHNLKHNKVLHKQILFVTVINHEVPRVEPEERLRFELVMPNCWQVWINFGFMDDTDLPLALSLMQDQGCNLNPMQTSYFVSRETIVPNAGGLMPFWREKIFAQLHRNASSVADFLKIPNNAVIELGTKVDL